MQRLPASQFLNCYTSVYGASWAEVFYDLTSEPMCAQHMAEFIDDLEMYGQQEPVYIDKEGMVDEGNRMALALAILGEDIEFTDGPAPEMEPNQVWEVEFDILSGNSEEFFNHLEDIFSFRCEDDWVYPLTASISGDEMSVIVFCRSGEYTADRLPPEISKRVERLTGASVTGVRVSLCEAVDEDTSEW